jgi:lantibiotic biosynthesis protein
MKSGHATARRARPWRPLLEGAHARLALDAVEAIIGDLAETEFEIVSSHERSLPYSLAYGSAGLSLFFSYAGVALESPVALELARRELGASLGALSEVGMAPDLFRGVAGIGWVFSHVKDWLWQPGDHDSCFEIDQLLTEWTREGSAAPELMLGLAGICVYALERLSAPSACELLESAIGALEASSRSDVEGIAWALAPDIAQRFVARERRLHQRGDLEHQFASGICLLGAAHGVAGVTAALAQVHAAGACLERAAPLLEESSRWLLAQRLPAGGLAAFPEAEGTDRPQLQSGWCNGDLGVAVALFNAGTTAGNSAICSSALQIARLEAVRRPEDVEPLNRSNPILCHGHAGRGHLFNRLFQATGEKLFAQAALASFAEVLRLREPGKWCGGFAVDEAGTRFVVKGFLMGAAGVGLALLAAATGLEPAWDRVLNASLPAPAAAAARECRAGRGRLAPKGRRHR